LLLRLTRVGVALVAIGTVLAGAFGLWLVHLGHWGYGSGWVDASIALFLAVIGLGGLGGRRPKQARLLATRLAEEDVPSNDELHGLLDDPVSRAQNYGSLALVLVIVAVMCFKP
jgi:MFS family permease